MNYLINTVTVAASTTYTAPLINLKTVLITISVALGIVIGVYGGIRFGIAFKKLDQNGELDAAYTIAAGGVLFGIGAIAAALGF